MYNILIRYMGHPYLPTLISPRYTVPYIYKYMIYIDDIQFFGPLSIHNIICIS